MIHISIMLVSMLRIHDACDMQHVHNARIMMLVSMMLVPFESVGDPMGGGPLSVTEKKKKKKDWDRFYEGWICISLISNTHLSNILYSYLFLHECIHL